MENIIQRCIIQVKGLFKDEKNQKIDTTVHSFEAGELTRGDLAEAMREVYIDNQALISKIKRTNKIVKRQNETIGMLEERLDEMEKLLLTVVAYNFTDENT